MTDEELFPHTGFPIRLEYDEHAEHKICWFQCERHLEIHITRYKLKEKDITIYRYGQQNETSFVDKPARKSAKPAKRKPVRRLSGKKTNKSKGGTAEATDQPKKRGRPRKVKDS